MRVLVGDDFGAMTFTPGAAGAGTLVFTKFDSFAPGRLRAVTNITRKTIIYAAEISGKAGAWSSLSGAGGTLTLDLDTSTHSSGDELRAIYDRADGPEIAGDNLLLADFGSPAYTPWYNGTSVTMTADYGPGPIPGTRSTRYQLPHGTGSFGARASFNVTGTRCSGNRITFSMWVKGTGTFAFTVAFYDTGSTHAVSSDTGVSLTGEWQRVVMSLETPFDDTVSFFVQIINTSGVDLDVEVFGADVRLNAPMGVAPDYRIPSGNSGASVQFDRTDHPSMVTWGDSMAGGSGGGWIGDYLSPLTGGIVANGGVGGETSSQVLTRVTADASGYNHYGWALIWAGRNNISDPTTVLSDIDSIVAALGHSRFVVCSVCNQTSEDYTSGNYGYAQQINRALSRRFGARFVDVRSAWAAGTADDTPDARWMYDATHPKGAGLSLAASLIYRRAVMLGYTPGNPDEVYGWDVPAPGIAEHTSVSTSTTSALLLAPGHRKSFTVVNESSVDMYLAYAAAASSTAYIKKLASGESYTDEWEGIVTAVLASSTGNARITEVMK